MRISICCSAEAALMIVALLPAHQAVGQGRPVEVGIDGAISVGFVSTPEGQESEDVQTWAFPVQRIRVGMYLANGVQAQLSSGFEVADYGSVSTVRFSFGLAGLVHLSGDRTKRGAYVSAGGGLDLLSEDESDVQWSAGGGGGYKIPLGDHLSLRPGLEIARWFASSRRRAETVVSGLIGVSVFLD